MFAVSVFDDAGNLQNVMKLLKEERGDLSFPYVKVELKPGESSADVDWVAVEKQFHVSTELNSVSLAFQNRLYLTVLHMWFLKAVLADVKQVDEQFGRLAPDLVGQFQVWKVDVDAFLGQLPRFPPRHGHFGRQRAQLIALKASMDRFIQKELVGGMMAAAERHDAKPPPTVSAADTPHGTGVLAQEPSHQSRPPSPELNAESLHRVTTSPEVASRALESIHGSGSTGAAQQEGAAPASRTNRDLFGDKNDEGGESAH
jgi:hypothetical protein